MRFRDECLNLADELELRAGILEAAVDAVEGRGYMPSPGTAPHPWTTRKPKPKRKPA